MVPQGQLTYAGVHAEGGFSVVRAGSAAPDPIIAKFYLGTVLPPISDVFLAFGGSVIRMRNCRIVKSSTTTRGGRMLECQIEDRRWAWKYPKLFCRFNDRVDGSLEYSRHILQIVQYIVFVLLRETDADLSALAVLDAYADFPKVFSDGEPAINVLEALLEERGFMIVLDLNDRLCIRRRGFGPLPPSDGLVVDQEYSVEPPVVPSRLFLMTAPIRFEKDLYLEPVGQEPNGDYVPINKLSYKPAGGWAKENPRFFPNVAVDLRELAKRCVWRMYRVVTPTALPVPELYPFETEIFTKPDRRSIFPLLNVRANDKPAEIYGYFTDTRVTQQNNAVAPAAVTDADFDGLTRGVAGALGIAENLVYPERFHLDVENGIVLFDRPVYYKERAAGAIATDSFLPAKLWLRTSFHVRQQNGQSVRQLYTYMPNLPYRVPGLTETVTDEDFEYRQYPVPWRGTTTREAVESWGLWKADSVVRSYLIDQNCVTRCAGFRFDRSPDGRMYAVRFDRSDDGESTTQLEWQTELTVERLSYAEKVRRLQDEVRDRQVRQAIIWQDRNRMFMRRLGRMQ